MRILIILFAVCLAELAYAQTGVPVSITLRDGTVLDTYIKSRTAMALITDKGRINLTEISSVTFKKNDPSYNNMIDALKEVDIAILYNSPITQAQAHDNISNDISSLRRSLEMFRQQRANGRKIILLGTLVASSGILVNALQKQPNTKLAIGLAYGGATITTIGSVVIINADKHLRQ